MKKAARVSGFDELIEEGSWGSRTLGKTEWTMDLYLNEDRSRGFIEWDIPDKEIVAHIGLTFEDGTLIDYDGVASISQKALDLIEGQGFDVSEMR